MAGSCCKSRGSRHVVAIGIDPEMLEIARHRLAESDAGDCDFVAGDAVPPYHYGVVFERS